LKLYEEIKPGMVEALKSKLSFAQSELQDGDIICSRSRYLRTSREHDLESRGLYSNPIQIYEFLQNRVMLIFRPQYKADKEDHPEFPLVLSKKDNYRAMAEKVGAWVKHDPLQMQFIRAVDGSPSSVIKQTSNPTVEEMITTNPMRRQRLFIIKKRALHLGGILRRQAR